MLPIRAACTLVLLVGAAAILPPTPAAVREFGSWFARPARLPFAWQALTEAMREGDAREAFARGQQIVQLVPSWTDGHAAFAYRYVLTQDAQGSDDEVAAAAERRLSVALAELERARAFAGRRELDLLQSAAFLPDVACRHFPGLAERLQPQGGAAAIAEQWLLEAERLFPTAAIREQRLWHTVTLAASLLDAGSRDAALAVVDAALERAYDVARDRDLVREWRARLLEARNRLAGDRGQDLRRVLADRRFEPLWPHLR